MPSNRDRLNVDINGLRSIIEQMAHQERRSLSSMVRILIEEGLRVRGKYPPPDQSVKDLPKMGELVKTWNFEELAKEARLPIERIEQSLSKIADFYGSDHPCITRYTWKIYIPRSSRYC